MTKDIGEFYGKHHRLFGYNKDLRDEMRKLLALYHLPINITFAEAGGSGCRALAMSRLGAKSYYIDLSGENIDRRKTNRLISICGSILDPQPIKDCDLVICRGVIHHTENPALALMNISKWLKVGGILQMNFYNGESEYFFWVDVMRKLLPKNVTYDELYKIIPYVNIEHLFTPIMNFGTPEIVIHDLNKLGFKIISSEKGFLYTFTARKIGEVETADLRYKPNLSLSLSRETSLNILLGIFNKYFRGKKRNLLKMALIKMKGVKGVK